MADDGQLVRVLGHVARLDGGVDQSRVNWTNREGDFLADALVVVDRQVVLEGARILRFGLVVLTGHLERGLVQRLVGKAILALNGDLLGNGGAHLDAVNLGLCALVTSEDLLQNEKAALEFLRQLLNTKGSLAKGSA